MGGTTSHILLYKALRNNKKEEVNKLLSDHKELINEPINDKKNQTPIIVCSIVNAYECLSTILEYNPDLTVKFEDKDCYFLSVEKDNIYILKELIEKKGIPETEIDGLNLLDWSILKISYRCSLYLYQLKKFELKSLDFYLEKNKDKSWFNLPVYYDCLQKEVQRGETPSFYLSTQQKKDLEEHVPDPNETWAAFFKRVGKFELYQPPLVKHDSIPIEKKNTLYMKMQSKLLEMEYDKNSKDKYNIISSFEKGRRREEEIREGCTRC